MRKVAIVGTAFRLPGTSTALFWEDLLAARDLVTRVDPARWSTSVYGHPDKAHPGTSYTFAAGSIGDTDGFDAGFFGISPREACLMDPQQRLLLEMSWEAFENAGIPPSSLRGSRCGVYIGISSSDYSWRLADDLAAIDSSFATGNTASIAANRLSYFYDLRGPSMALDTACSSSLVAFHQAHQSILSGETSLALAGSINLHLHPLGFVSFSKASMLSRSGRCRVFDADADGYVRSEGGAVFLLKDYEQAIADGNPIIAVIAHTAVNTDGHKSGITVPSPSAQAALLTAAYRQAGIRPDEIDYIEAHGTGTPVGDPIEAQALGEALGRHRPRSQPLPIGSVKGNVGHLESASGAAGLIKALLCLQHRMVPAHVGMQTPNPRIAFSDLNLEVVTANRQLRAHGQLTVGINSFGFGGANAHVILHSHASDTRSAATLPRADSLPIVVSARDPQALKAAARELSHFIGGQPQGSLYDISYQLVHGREPHPHRAMLFGRTPTAVASLLEQFADDIPSLSGVESGSPVAAAMGPAFVYSGNGAQWAGMGRALLADQTFRTTVREIDALLSRYADYSIESELTGENGENRYHLTEVAQPALFAMQVGMTAMLRRRGLIPMAVTGHSVGEVAAAWASGALSLPAAVSVIHHRSTLQATTRGVGGMTAISLSETSARELLSQLHLAEQLSIAGVNSSCGVTVAGPIDALDRLESSLKGRSIVHVRLGLDYAFHSPAMDGLSTELRRALAYLEPEETAVPFYSTVTGERISGRELDADYWWHNIRKPVLFEPAVRTMVHAGINVFVEIGPQAPLTRYLQDGLTDAKITGRVISTAKRGDDSPQRVYSSIAQAMVAGARIDWQSLLPWRGRFVNLPNYPWQRGKYWHPTTSASLGLIARKIEHPLLGHAINQSDWTWENELDTVRFPALADHVVGDATVFPGTGYAELAIAMALRWQATELAQIEDLEIRAPLLLSGDSSRSLRCSIDTSDGQLSVRSREYAGSDTWSLQSVARILREPNPTRLEALTLGALPTRQPDFTAISHERLTLAAGLKYGPAFQAISHGWIDADEATAVAVLVPREAVQSQLEQYHLHPAILDSAFQLVIQLMRDVAADYRGLTFIPIRIGHLTCRAGSNHPAYARVRMRRLAPHSLCADYELFDADARPIALLEEVRLRSVRLRHGEGENLHYLQYVAVPRPISMPRQWKQPGARAAMDAAIRRCFRQPETRRIHRQYAQEVEPLLDVLCERFSTEAQQSDHAQHWPDGPFASHLLRAAQADRTQDAESGTARNIWNSLIGDYPDFFPLIHAVGCVGTHLSELVRGRRTLAETLSASLTRNAVQLPVLGAAVRLGLASAVRAQIDTALRSLGEGERLRVVEISATAPLFAPDVLPTIDFDRIDYRFLSSQSMALDAAQRLQESHPSLVIDSLDADVASSDGMLAIVTLNFRSLAQTLQALDGARARLARGGLLLALGQHPSPALDFIFGADPEWWGPSTAASDQSAQQSAAYFQQSLHDMGFVHSRIHQHAADTPCGAYALLASYQGATCAVPAQQARTRTAKAPRHWLLLHDAANDGDSLARALAAALTAAGDQVSQAAPNGPADMTAAVSTVVAALGPLHGIVQLGGLPQAGAESPAALLEFQVQRCAMTAALIQMCESAQMEAGCCLVTMNAAGHLLPERQTAGGCEHHALADAALAGFARTLMNEASTGAVRWIDLVTGGRSLAQTAQALCEELQLDDPEQEIILSAAGARFAPRLRAVAAPRAPSGQPRPEAPSRHRLGFLVPGQLRHLQWQQIPQPALADSEIEVSVRATGLNFRDVMYALGLLSDEGVEQGFAGASLGLEFSGTVLRIGDAVKGFKTGDAVVGFASASFGDQVITTSDAVARIPAGLSFEAAATIPSAFFTAYYALHELAGLHEGEKILIHGAAGGVGVAAIQLAKLCGAEVFATAGSEEKRDFVRLLGADHVFDSRSLAYADQILDITNGRGIDVVLNSLAGEAINRNLRVLKPFGRFLELGKRDFYENTRVGLRPFRNNISYFGIDADQLMRERPEFTRRVFGKVLALFRQRALHALPYQSFEARDVVDAFRQMQQARHIGKIVVTYGAGIPATLTPATAKPPRLTLRADATYLVTGGLRGFGLRTAQWLVERGARHLILLARHGAANDEAQSVIADLDSRGVRVHACACDVTDRSALAGVLERSAQEGPPIRGIIHAAAVIEDGLIRDLDAATIRRVLAPKVLGALHLHELTRALPLDFFVLYSSATTLFGNPGQASYVAANSALEAVARRRREQGLPVTCVRWGAIDDVGFLARNPKLKDALLDRMGGAALPAQAALDLLEAMLLSNHDDVGVLELDWRSMRRFLPTADAAKFIELARAADHGESEDDGVVDLERLLRELPEDELLTTVADMLKAEIGEILRIAPDRIDPAQPIHEMGFDSLMGVELTVAVENRFGVRLPVLALSDSPTVLKLAAWVIKQLSGEESASTHAQIEHIAGQHAVSVASAHEVERFASELHDVDTGGPRRMIQ